MADIAALMREADQALCRAKHTGRNRVVATAEVDAGWPRRTCANQKRHLSLHAHRTAKPGA